MASNYGPTVLTGFSTYLTSDNGMTWTQIENGMRADARIMAFQNYNGMLFSGNDTRSVWQWSEALVNSRTTVAEFSVAPNPTSAIVSVLGVESADIVVYNSLGLQILRQTGPAIDLSSQPAGIYLMQIVTPTGTATKRVVRQ